MPRTLLLLLGCIGLSGQPAPAQQPAIPERAGPARLRLFLDCATSCDREFLRTEIRMVAWVTDRIASDLHVLATSIQDGAGGDSYTLEFIGRGGRLEGLTDRHTFRTAPDATADEVRGEFARVLRLGLVRYLLVVDQGGDACGDRRDRQRQRGAARSCAGPVEKLDIQYAA